MNHDPEFVESIVQEVIRRLTALGLGLPAPKHGSTVAPAARELVVPDRLITLATLKDRLNGVTRVVVPRRAIITPAVRDELRSRKIELTSDT